MHQFIYGIGALGITVLLTVSLSNGTRRAAQRVYLNETMTQLSGVAYDVLEDIERAGIAFDERTDESRHPKPIAFPLVKSAKELTPENRFGGCTNYAACRDIDDFHGLRITRSTQGYDFVVDLSVRYVDEDAPSVVSSTQTFAKRIDATVSHPTIDLNGRPLRVTMSRTVTYHRITEKAGIWL